MYNLKFFTTFICSLLIRRAVIAAPVADTSASKAFIILASSDGKTTINTLQQGKVVIINFWAMSCVPCLQEMATISKLATRYKDSANVLVIPVDLDRDLVNSTGFMTKQHYCLPVYTLESQVPDGWFRGVLPTTIVIDKRGKLAYYHEGGNDYCSPEFIKIIAGMLKK